MMVLEECQEEVRGWLDLRLVSGACSTILIDQLAQHMQARSLDVFAVYEAIGFLEDRPRCRHSPTKPATPFTGDRLRGLWHKHIFTARDMAANLAVHWMKPGRFEDEVQALLKDPNYDEDRWIEQLGHRIVFGGYQSRYAATAMTGEWLVYAKVCGRNLYLTLGVHNDDERIFERAERAGAEFGVTPSDWRGALI